MARKRAICPDFLKAMRKGLDKGRRRGYVGWDQRWENCVFASPGALGLRGALFSKLQDEMNELTVAVAQKDSAAIFREAADVANMAMMVADIHRVSRDHVAGVGKMIRGSVLIREARDAKKRMLVEAEAGAHRDPEPITPTVDAGGDPRE